MSVNHRFGTILVILVVALVGCGGPSHIVQEQQEQQEQVAGPALSWETLDSFNFNVVEAEPGLVFPASYLYERIYFSRVAAAGGWAEDSVIEFFRDSLVVDTLIGLTAPEYELWTQWHIHREYLRRTNNFLSKLFWEKNVGAHISIDSQQVIDYYNEHQLVFSIPEQADMYHIQSSKLGFYMNSDSLLIKGMSPQEVGAFAEVYVRQLHQLLKYGEAFENVAYNFSHDVMSREKGGRLGWSFKEKYLDPFDSVAFGLENGEFSEPYQDVDGWHILYRAAHNPGGPQPLELEWVYDRARQGVIDAQASGMTEVILADLRATTTIKENPRILTDTVIYDFPDTAWAAVINGTDTIDVLDLKELEDGFRRGYKVGNTTPEMRSSMILQSALPVRIVQRARAEGLDSLPEYREFKQKIWNETVKAHVISVTYAHEDWRPTDSAVEAYYNAHYDDFHPTDHIEAEQLIVEDFDLANFLRDQMNLGLDLEYLARYYSDDGYDVKYEDLGIVRKGEIDQAMYDALNSTHAQRTTRVTKTKRGYQIGKVLKREYERTLDGARVGIRSILTEQHRWERWAGIRDEMFREHRVRFPGNLPRFELPRLSERNHPRTLPTPVHGGPN